MSIFDVGTVDIYKRLALLLLQNNDIAISNRVDSTFYIIVIGTR